jgi:hypothetical protein
LIVARKAGVFGSSFVEQAVVKFLVNFAYFSASNAEYCKYIVILLAGETGLELSFACANIFYLR